MVKFQKSSKLYHPDWQEHSMMFSNRRRSGLIMKQLKFHLQFNSKELSKGQLYRQYINGTQLEHCNIKKSNRGKWLRIKADYLRNWKTWDRSPVSLPKDNSRLPNIRAIKKCLRMEGRSFKQKSRTLIE